MAFICRTLIEQDVKGQVCQEITNSWYTFNGDIVESWIFLLIGIDIPKIELFAIVLQALFWEIE